MSRLLVREGALFTLTLLAMVVFAMPAQAEPIDGSTNGVVNAGFDSEWDSWEHGSGLTFGYDYEADPVNRFVMCLVPMSDLLLRQIVDVSPNPLWNENYHQMIIDLTVDIWAEKVEAGYGITFWLDWWEEDKNSISDPTLLGEPDGKSDPVIYMFTDLADQLGYVSKTWLTVNPFNRDEELFAEFQPRWVSVEAELIQPGGYGVGVDNFILTTECVPEPATLSLVLVLSGLALSRRWR
ncbi:MAG: PEP-CTERM sorting domain-containing protein [Phycisphaerales bacterium]|nr:PEP-CTERM sorting domain-containing protein [Phycisphaerales bacterium]